MIQMCYNATSPVFASERAFTKPKIQVEHEAEEFNLGVVSASSETERWNMCVLKKGKYLEK
jgi:hypothetical protein